MGGVSRELWQKEKDSSRLRNCEIPGHRLPPTTLLETRVGAGGWVEVMEYEILIFLIYRTWFWISLKIYRQITELYKIRRRPLILFCENQQNNIAEFQIRSSSLSKNIHPNETSSNNIPSCFHIVSHRVSTISIFENFLRLNLRIAKFAKFHLDPKITNHSVKTTKLYPTYRNLTKLHNLIQTYKFPQILQFPESPNLTTFL